METQMGYAATTAPSLVSRIFGGPINGPNLGEIVINETFLFAAVAIAFMSTLAIVRHTRQNEETGRAELIGSAVVGRHASLTAALAVTIGANIILGLLLGLVLQSQSLDAVGSWGTAAAWSAIGISFAGVAAITAQLSESARGANGQAAAIIGVAFLLRGIGDGLGSLAADRLGVLSAWPSWLSPLGWGQQLHPYTQQRWSVFALYAAFSLAVVITAYALAARRDVGLGILPARKGPARAAHSLLSVVGLARRLQRGTLRGWSVGVLVMGLSLGLVTKEFSKLLQENPEVQEYLGQLGDGSSLEDFFFTSMLALGGIAISAYSVQALQRLRAEESGGQLEPVLATRTSRLRWMLSHIGYSIAGGAWLLVLFGASMGLAYVLAADASWSQMWQVTSGALVQLPALLVLIGVAALAFGAIPRAAIAVGWAAFAICLLIGQFGEILKLPQMLRNISPFTHLPAVPVDPVKILPLAILLAIAAGLLVMALAAFRQRDITTG
jgi:ABC-2 type transport system permease protein